LVPVSPSGLLRSGDVQRVATTLRGGGLAVLPTETGYMLAALATSMDALRRAFAAKGRDTANPMHIACASLAMAHEVAHIPRSAERVIAEFTPGPLTAVVRHRDVLPRSLVTLNGTVGIRIPDSAATLQVVAAVGSPVTATSVNRSGEEGVGLSRAVLDELDWGDLAEVPVVRHAGAVMFMSPSTLVRLTDSEPEILRQGPVSAAEVAHVLAGGSAPRRPPADGPEWAVVTSSA
jgi:L-threonylcarbamoyladenylate synthase